MYHTYKYFDKKLRTILKEERAKERGDEVSLQDQRVLKRRLNWSKYVQDHNYKKKGLKRENNGSSRPEIFFLKAL